MGTISPTSNPPTGDDVGDLFRRYRAAVARTDALIERGQTPVGKSRAEIQARAEQRLARVGRFLAFLGNPQDDYAIVHVAGTSGKGSTAAAVAAILTAAGYRTGLHTSPYLQAATEKIQVDDRLIAPEAFAGLVDDVLRAMDAWAQEGGERLTYGEVWVALMALHFARSQVEIAVIEVGAGGRFDLTNVVRPTVSVVTEIGLDHTVTLGSTIPEIAWHKAGIIKSGAPVVTSVTDPAALAPLVAEAARAGTPLTRVVPGQTFEVLRLEPGRTIWRERRPGAAERPAPPGRFQAANAATAVAAVRLLADRGFPVTDDAVGRGLATARLPGRVERMPMGPDEARVLLDGAHNPQKIGALAADLDLLLPRGGNGRRLLILGVVEAKAYDEITARIAPWVDEVIATSPGVLGKPGLAAETLAASVRAAGFSGQVVVEPDPPAALARTLATVAGPDDAILVTGSLYLIGQVRERWYPEREVVLQRTPWPRSAGDAATKPRRD